MTGRNQVRDDGSARTSKGYRSSGITRTPRYVLARTEEEVGSWCNVCHVDRDKIIWLQDASQIKDLPEDFKFRLQRTGTWYLADKDVLADIEVELAYRKEHIG